MARELGSRAVNIPIFVKQGSDWSVTFWIENAAGTKIPLSGSSFRGSVKKNPLDPTTGTTPTFDFVVNVDDTVTVSFPKAKSIAMTAGPNVNDPSSTYYYDWEWVKVGGDVDRIQEGIFTLSREITN